MAEIHVERKPKKPVWPWVVILIILLLVAIGWWFFSGTTNEQIPGGMEINLIEQAIPKQAIHNEVSMLLSLHA